MAFEFKLKKNLGKNRIIFLDVKKTNQNQILKNH